MDISSALICFVACHGASADHFAVFAEDLKAKGHNVEIYATGPATAKFQGRNIFAEPFELENRSERKVALEVAKKCAKAAVVITDVGHRFNIALQRALAKEAPKSLRVAYYENPENYVPGGYSETAAKVMRAAERVLFANANLAKTPLYQELDKKIRLASERKIGLGYYPIEQAVAIAKKREGMEALRARLFASQGLQDRKELLLVYAGGNNEEYFGKAWPAFLRFLREAARQKDLSNTMVVLQQHPCAKKENRDGKLLEEFSREAGMPRLVISSMSTDEMAAAADRVLYYQTSMAPQFVLAGIPTIQVGHNTYEDILVKNKLCASATNAEEFLNALQGCDDSCVKPVDANAIHAGLGIHSDWSSKLEDFIQKAILGRVVN